MCKCGNECLANASLLRLGKRRSCGCFKTAIGEERWYAWKGCGEISGEHWAGIRHGATSRKLDFNISIQEAWQLFLSQDRKCKLSGVELSFSQKKATASLDRIDSSVGYVNNNIQWLHKDVNFMKQNFKEDHFINLCKLIAEKN